MARRVVAKERTFEGVFTVDGKPVTGPVKVTLTEVVPGGGSSVPLDQREQVTSTSRGRTLLEIPVVMSAEHDREALRFASGEQPYVRRWNVAFGLVGAVVALAFVLVAIVRS